MVVTIPPYVRIGSIGANNAFSSPGPTVTKRIRLLRRAQMEGLKMNEKACFAGMCKMTWIDPKNQPLREEGTREGTHGN
jgi:hypothetical protein